MFTKKKEHPVCHSSHLFVAGIDSITIPLHFTPDVVAAEFCDDHTHVHPSCNPVPVDTVCSKIVRHEHGHAIMLAWEVATQREIKWVVCGHKHG